MMAWLRRRLALATVLALTVSLFGVSAVLADPVNNPHSEVITIECDGQTIDVVVAMGAPGHVVGSTSVGIPKSGTFRVFVNDVLVDEESFTQGKGVKNLTTCTFSEEFVDPDTGDTIRFEGEFEVLITPRGPRS